MGMFSFLDADNDGTALDDISSTAVSAAGGVLEVGGTAAMGVGASILAASLVADATGVGAIAGVPLGVAGGGLMGVGALAGLSGMALSSDVGTGVAEEAGDFTADLWGTRDVNNRRDPLEPIGDDHYRHLAEGRGSPGNGQQLHDWLTGSESSSQQPAPTPQSAPASRAPDSDVDMVFTERERDRFLEEERAREQAPQYSEPADMVITPEERDRITAEQGQDVVIPPVVFTQEDLNTGPRRR